MIENQTGDMTVYSPYTLPQPAGLLAVREYLLTDVEGERLLILRWVRETEVPVDAMTYEIVMLDAVGAELGRRTATHLAADIPPAEIGAVFTLKRGIPVDEGCRNIRIRITEVRSGSYVYRTSGSTVVTDYIPEEPWSYDPNAGNREKLTDRIPLRVRSKRMGRVHHLWPVALLIALLLAAVITLPALTDILTNASEEASEVCFATPQIL